MDSNMISRFKESTFFRVELSDTASKRTINRVKNHGPIFDAITINKNPPETIAKFVGSPAVLLKNSRWMGWVPLSDVIITPEDYDG